MGKNRLVLHMAAILVTLVFGFMAVSSSATVPKKGAVKQTDESGETLISSTTISKGRVNYMVPPHEKSYETLGLVFATSVTEFDENGYETSNQEGVTTMLLREAQKLGADDILNLRIDENTVIIQITEETKSTSGTTKKTLLRRTVTYTGSALAIKYNDKPVPASNESFGKFTPGSVTIQGKFE